MNYDIKSPPFLGGKKSVVFQAEILPTIGGHGEGQGMRKVKISRIFMEY